MSERLSGSVDKKINTEDEVWNAKIRLMFNGDIVLPYSVAFVLKRFENFDSANFKASVIMTLIIRIKFSGLDELSDKDHMEEAMNYVEKK
jgi:hypothetical protein